MKLNIEELDDQAEKIADEKCQTPGEYHPDWHSVYAESLARLIVERCAQECESLFDLDDDSCNEAEKCAAAIRNLMED